jgi:hypothetical protein
MHQWVATSPDIVDLKQLRNKRVVGKPLFVDGKFCGHGDGNKILLLELQGIDTRTVELLMPKTVGDPIDAVKNGKAEAYFVKPERAAAAEAAGLKVWRLKPMPMVHSITFTTTRPRLEQQEGFGDRIMKVLVDATHFYKTKKEETLELLKNPIDPMFEGAIERISESYDESAAEYETKPYPRAEAIVNVHKLACMVYPEARTVNPLELWDTQTLRGIHSTGYVDNLYNGRDRVIADIQRTLAHGECDDC